MLCTRLVVSGGVVLMGAMAALRGQPLTAPAVVLDMGTGHGYKPTEVEDPATKQKVPCGTLEPVEGVVGPAIRFSFREGALGGYMNRWLVADERWDQAAGLSFWVKGDGSGNWGGLELIDGETYAHRYGFCFPIDSTEWRKVTMPWRDLIPILSSPLLAPDGGFRPSAFRNLWFGKRGYWREAPACSFALDEVALDPVIEMDARDYPPEAPGLGRFLAKLKGGKPVTIVALGDSLTDRRHWANREKAWVDELAKGIESAYGAKLTLVNAAIGGTTLSQNLILMPRWLKEAPHPDLVTVWFGYNDWDTGVRKDRLKEYLNLAVDRIRRLTAGSADVLLLTTCPAYERWETMSELCQAELEVARDRGAGLADVASAFRRAPSAEEALRLGFWAWDKTHLGPAGHDLVAATVLAAIAAEGLADLKAGPNAYWAKVEAAVLAPAGQTLLSSFEPGQENGVVSPAGKIVAENATAGRHALRLESLEKDYAAASVEDGRALALVRQNTRVLVDVFNPGTVDVTLNVMVKDPRSADYQTRYNGAVTVRPGASTIDVDYTRLPRTGTAKAEKPDLIDPSQITLVVFFLDPHGAGAATVLFLDQVRLAP
jgi:lysophospholipase L1-like esterase